MAKEIHPNLALAAVISELPVHCEFHSFGCNAALTVETLDSHISSPCPFKPLTCPFSSLGCQFIGVPTLKDHHCVFEQMQVFIVGVNERIAGLEDKVVRQNKELERLREFVRTNKTNPMLPVLSSPVSDDLGVETDSINVNSQHWSLGPLECTKTIKNHSAGVTSLAYSPGYIFSGAHNGVIDIYSETLDQSEVKIAAHKSTVWSLAHDAHSDILFSASSDKTVSMYSLSPEQPALLGTLNEHSGKIYSLLLDGSTLFSCSSDKTIKVWNSEHCLSSGSLSTLTGHTGSVNGIACSRSFLISASSDQYIKVWDIVTGQNAASFHGDSSEVLDVAHSTTTGLIYASTYDASILCFDPRASEANVGTLVGHNWEGGSF